MGTCLETGNAESITSDSGREATPNSMRAGVMHTPVPLLFRTPQVVMSMFPYCVRGVVSHSWDSHSVRRAQEPACGAH